MSELSSPDGSSPHTKHDPGAGPRRLDGCFSIGEVLPLFAEAHQQHDQYEQLTGQAVAPEEYRGSSSLVRLSDSEGRLIRIDSEAHGDRTSLEVLESALRELDGKPLSEIAFWVEGSSKPGTTYEPWSSCKVLVGVADAFGLPLFDPVMNINDWKVVEGVIERAALEGIGRDSAIGFLAGSFAAGPQQFNIGVNLIVGVEDFREDWEEHVGIVEMYRYASKLLLLDPERLTAISSEVRAGMSRAIAREPMLALKPKSWETAQVIIAELEQLGMLGKEEFIGLSILSRSPGAANEVGFPDFSLAMLSAAGFWGEGIEASNVHLALLNFQRKQLLNPTETFEESKRVLELLMKVQDDLTTPAMRRLLQNLPDTKYLVGVNGLHHTDSLRAAFECAES